MKCNWSPFSRSIHRQCNLNMQGMLLLSIHGVKGKGSKEFSEMYCLQVIGSNLGQSTWSSPVVLIWRLCLVTVCKRLQHQRNQRKTPRYNRWHTSIPQQCAYSWQLACQSKVLLPPPCKKGMVWMLLHTLFKLCRSHKRHACSHSMLSELESQALQWANAAQIGAIGFGNSSSQSLGNTMDVCLKLQLFLITAWVELYAQIKANAARLLMVVQTDIWVSYWVDQ